MRHLRGCDLRAILDVTYLIHSDDREATADRVLAELARLVACDHVAFNGIAIDPAHLLATAVHPRDANRLDMASFAALFDQHPGFQAYRSRRLQPGTSAVLSDLLTVRALRRLPLYADCYRPAGTHDQLIGGVHVGRQSMVLTVSRSRIGFSHRDRAVIDVLLPHLGQALRRRARLASLTAAARRARANDARIHDAGGRLRMLTRREREVAEHVATGASDREIAGALGVGVRTVHKHLEQTYRKLGLANRASLIAALHEADQRSD